MAEDKMVSLSLSQAPAVNRSLPDNGSQLSGKDWMKSVVSYPSSLFQKCFKRASLKHERREMGRAHSQ